MNMRNITYPLAYLVSMYAVLLTASCDENSSFQATQISLDKLHPEVLVEYNLINAAIQCDLPMQCMSVVSFDCNASVDGPKNYYNNISGEPIMFCGGACFMPDPTDPLSCKSCPPNEWACSN